MRRRVLWLLMAFLGCMALPASAHEVRPAYLEIHEQADGGIDVLWKQPVVGDRMVPLRPHISGGWLEEQSTRLSITDTAMLRQWHVAPPHEPLVGQVITIEGLETTLTDVLLSVRYADGETLSRVINPANPRFEVPESDAVSIPVRQYLWLGITHIWGGIDHLAYVLGLIMLVVAVRPLLITLTSFTLAHSITLALTTLDVVRLPTGAVEATIALSIVYLAVELVRQSRGEEGWASRHPWAIAFSFGLLHGFGFAGALREVGLPATDIPAVLLLFNLGIEIGQVAFVLVVLAVAWLLKRVYPLAVPFIHRWGPYALGSLASYWFIGRLGSL